MGGGGGWCQRAKGNTSGTAEVVAPRKVRPVQQAGRARGSLSRKLTLLCWEVSRRSVLSPGAGPGNPV